MTVAGQCIPVKTITVSVRQKDAPFTEKILGVQEEKR